MDQSNSKYELLVLPFKVRFKVKRKPDRYYIHPACASVMNLPLVSASRTCRVALCLLLVLIPVSQAAHSRRRIVITREKETYDRVITDFSPDGRLNQVEYGMEASRRGSTIAAAVTVSAGICLVIQNSSFGKVHRIDHHIWLATAGLSGDARFLAGHLRTSCQRHRMDCGEPPTVEEVANMAGQFQHYLTRAGGIRPLGCTALVLGIDPADDEEKELGVPRLFQTDPGGIVEACTSPHFFAATAAGSGCDSVMKDIGSIISGRSFSPGEESGTLLLLASKMAQIVLGKLQDPKVPVVDVWTFEPRRGKRGGMQAICYQQVDKDSVSKLRTL